MISGRHFRFRLDPAMSRVVGHRPAPPNLPVLSSYIPPWRRPLRPCTRLYGNRSRHALPAPGAAPTPLVWRATTQRLSMRCCRLGHDGAAPPRLPCVDGQSGLQVGSETICGVGCCSLLSVLAGSGDRFERKYFSEKESRISTLCARAPHLSLIQLEFVVFKNDASSCKQLQGQMVMYGLLPHRGMWGNPVASLNTVPSFRPLRHIRLVKHDRCSNTYAY
ncbi:uncharacterized protein [Triticum aestivum]|uniref:uncharacterized protein isoform X2 n=1 Tax=Triticum aestivum TaxID=4565 RepID=UPI001D016862|nr:uncharacterized protein LOC123073898 isoform X2 [Triticum aestivum]